MKKILSIVALSLVIASEASMVSAKTLDNPDLGNPKKITEECSEQECENCHKDKKKHKEDVKMLSDEKNNCHLSDDQKKDLKKISDCLNDGKDLSEEQVKIIIVLKESVEKGKLGDKDYKKYKELKNKEMEKKDKLSDKEKSDLDGYCKRLRE